MIRWQLELGNEIIALVMVASYDFPWINGRLVDSPKFERFRVYFSDEHNWPDTPEFDALCSEILSRGRFQVRNLDTGDVFHNLRLNHDGDDVWFRYS